MSSTPLLKWEGRYEMRKGRRKGGKKEGGEREVGREGERG